MSFACEAQLHTKKFRKDKVGNVIKPYIISFAIRRLLLLLSFSVHFIFIYFRVRRAWPGVIDERECEQAWLLLVYGDLQVIWLH